MNWRNGTIIEIGKGEHDNCQLENSKANVIQVDLFNGEFYDNPISFEFLSTMENLWFATDKSIDAIASSHVLEHSMNPVGAILEWIRCVKDGGYIYINIPHKERMFDSHRNLTTKKEFYDNYFFSKHNILKKALLNKPKYSRKEDYEIHKWFIDNCNHYSVFDQNNFLELLELCNEVSIRKFDIVELNENADAPNKHNSLDALLKIRDDKRITHVLYNTEPNNSHTNYHSIEFQNIIKEVQGHTVVTFEKLYMFNEIVKNYKNFPAAELGVFKGGTAYLMGKHIKQQIYLFDTFEGMPETSEVDQHKKGDFSNTSYSEVSNYLKKYDNINILKGEFNNRKDEIPDSCSFGFVHLDADIYTSTLDSLNFFYNKMIIGGSILLDDYDFKSTKGCRVAVDEFLQDKSEHCVSLPTGQGLIIKRDK